MTVHYRRSRRRLGDMVKFPGLGLVDGNYSAQDVLAGMAIGLGGTLAIKYFGNKMATSGAMKLPDFVLKASPLMGGAIVGAAAYFLEKGKTPNRAAAHAFGAVTAGLAVQAWDSLKTQFAESLGDVVTVRLNDFNGVMVDEPRHMAGVLVDENPALNELAALSMSYEDDSEFGD